MEIKRIGTLAAAAVIGMAGLASGANIAFDNGGGDWLWTNPLNWDGNNVLPGTSDQARLNGPAGGTVLLNGAVAINNYIGGHANTSKVAIVSGGSLTSGNILVGNYTAANSHLLTIDGGSITGSAFLRAGVGSVSGTGVNTVEMKSGTVNITTQTSIGYAGGVGVYNQSGGSWSSQSFRLGENQAYSSGLVVISDGTLSVTADLSVGKLGNGSMTISGGNVSAGSLNINETGVTTVDANLSLLGGTLSISEVTDGGVEIGGNDTLHIEGGTLLWNGDHLGYLDTLVTAYSLTWDNGQSMLGAYDVSWTNGTSILYADYNDINAGKTTVWVSPIPEPATMGLISMAAVALIGLRRLML